VVVYRRLIAVAHAVQVAVQVVEPRPLRRLTAPTLVHQVIELAAAARWRGGWNARVPTAATPFGSVSYHLQRLK
jgi:hypothetical protein